MTEKRYISTEYLGKCDTCRHLRSGGCNTYCDHGEEYSPSLLKIPTADVVEVKHGKWISVEGDVIFKCSNCEAEVKTSWDYENEDMFRYCPCCGAKMGGE